MIKYQNDCLGQNTGNYIQLHQNQSNSVVMEAIEMTLRDIGNMGDGVRPGRATVRHRYRRSIYIILVSIKHDSGKLSAGYKIALMVTVLQCRETVIKVSKLSPTSMMPKNSAPKINLVEEKFFHDCFF